MDHNTYKSQKPKGLFAYLERAIRFRDPALHGFPERYMPRLLFLFLIGISYVGNTHYYERMVRKLGQLEQEVDALKVDYTTLKADYMFDSKQSEIARKAAKMGLYETPYPPLKIKLK